MSGRDAAWNIQHEDGMALHSARPIRVDLRRRSLIATPPGIAQALQLMCEDGGTQLADVYSRPGELVARYDGLPAHNSTTEIRWSVEAAADGWRLDWLASMQTDRMDLVVNCTCRSQWQRQPTWIRTEDRGWVEMHESIWEAEPDMVVRGLAVQLSPNRTYCEFIWPADYDGLYVGRTMEYTVSAWRLVEPHLERGVIRRMRLRAVHAAISCESDALDRLYDAFLNSPVPLTA